MAGLDLSAERAAFALHIVKRVVPRQLGQSFAAVGTWRMFYDFLFAAVAGLLLLGSHGWCKDVVAIPVIGRNHNYGKYNGTIFLARRFKSAPAIG